MKLVILLQPAEHARLVEKDGEKTWQVKSKEYGWERVQTFQAIMALNNCTEIHNRKDFVYFATKQTLNITHPKP